MGIQKVMLFFVFLMIYPLVAYTQVEQGFILNPHQNNSKVEFFLLKPHGEGPFPVMFLLHGHQPPENNIGGKQFADLHYLDNFARKGIVAVAISIPGFGNSEGMRDFVGPNSQKAIAVVLEYFSHLSFIDAKRMGIYGISNGATLASMVHLYFPHLSLQILESGLYDLTTCRALMPAYLEKMQETIRSEAGDTQEALKERSAVYHAQNIHAKTLILHGEFDDRRGLPSAKALHEQLLREGKDSYLKIYPNELHCLPRNKWETIDPFLREQFFQLFGIGMKATRIMPAIQIAKILPGSPADISGKLKVGDVILRISPNNDDTEIDTLRMSEEKYTSLILGKKGTSVRLHVQHFDLTFDDIVIERRSNF